jgi:hypothetical protein
MIQIASRPDLPAAVMDEFFLGPTLEEQALGLERITSGFTGYNQLRIENGIAHIYLVGHAPRTAPPTRLPSRSWPTCFRFPKSTT